MSELEQLQGALDAYQGEVSSAMQTTKLTQEKLQDALSVIKVLTRERDEALEIAERTHTDMHAVRKELEQQRQRAEAAEAKLAAVPDYAAYYATAWETFEANSDGPEPLDFAEWLAARAEVLP